MRSESMVTHPFEPVYNENSRILILGSFPSVKSREQQFYYGHPQNRFWKVMGSLLKEPVPQTIDEKRRLLLDHHIAVWDVIASCEIKGSSDSSIRNVTPTDIASLVTKTQITRIFCNGKTSGSLYGRYQERIVGIPAVTLPSTSPANAAYSLERLVEEWGKAFLS